MSVPVSIVIPAHNQLDYCRQCIESIHAHTDYPHKLILVDNGSTDGVSAYFDSIAGATVIHSDRNLGFPAGVNLGLEHAEGHVLLLNSDTIVPSHWLSRLVAAMQSAPRVGVVGPMSNYVAGHQLIPNLSLTSINGINAYAELRANENAGELSDVEHVIGFCMLIRDAAFREVGKLDETFGIGNFEDDDYCMRVRKAGYRVCIAHDCFVFHYGSRTFESLGFKSESFNDLIAENEAKFNAKWGTSSVESRSNRIARGLVEESRNFANNGDTREALRCLKQAISMEPTNAECYVELGAFLVSIGEKQRAGEQFRRALRIEPNHELARQFLDDLTK